MEQYKDITLQKVFEARNRIVSIIRETPLVQSSILSKKLNKNISLKLENLQPSGAFKLRGAANSILSLTKAEQKRGVVTVSTGNHGKAVAYVARKLGIKAIVCISELIPKVKIEAMEALSAEVAVVGKNQDEATKIALQMQREEGLQYIPPFDDPLVIAGQGTTALEIIEKHPNTDTLLVPLSGGGLISGMALVAKSINPDIKVLGVSNDTEPAIYKSIQAGHIVQVDEFESLADALPGPIADDNQYTFEMCKRYVDDIILISETQIAQAMAYSLLKEKMVLEGGGAITLAALLTEKTINFGQNIVAVCSGNSVDISVLFKIAQEHKAYINHNF